MYSLPVLVYHRITRDGEGLPSDYVVDAELFERQLAYFSEHGFYTPLVADALQGRDERSSGRRPFLITFDDGYVDTLENALPLLMKYDFRAVVFMIADPLRRYNFWDDGKGVPRAPLMDAEQILKLRSSGLEIGAHTISHPMLPALDDAALHVELSQGREWLEGLLHEPVDYIAYPYGGVDRRVMDAARAAGFKLGFATNSGPMRAWRAPYCIRRTTMKNSSSPFYLFCKLSGIEKMLRICWTAAKGIRSRLIDSIKGEPGR